MRHTQADIETALRHVREIERRIEEQRARIERLRNEGQPTVFAEGLLATLSQGAELLKAHLAIMTGSEVTASLKKEDEI
jgi:hypothetical protein